MAGFSPGMSDRTFFVTTPTYTRKVVFESKRMCDLLLDVLRHYRKEERFLLHAFVMMPDHVHLLITPAQNLPLEKCVQLIKGNFSFRAKRELGYRSSVWAAGFNKDRAKAAEAYEAFRTYIHNNPVRRGLVVSPELYEASSAWPGRRMDPSPFARAKAQSK
jgi:putative transposase